MLVHPPLPHPARVPPECYMVAALRGGPDAELHGAAENAFVTLNPHRISVDDIIV